MSQQQNAPSPPAVQHGFLPMPFRCTTSNAGIRIAWVAVSGEVDLTTAPEVERALRAAVNTSRLTVLDLRALEFLDSSGLHVIEDASLYALLRGRRLVVSRAPGHFRRILALTGTSEAIELREVDPTPGLSLV